MKYDLLFPAYWVHDRVPPDMVLDGTVGGCIDWLVRVVEQDGQWTLQRRTYVSKVMRRFAQLFIAPKTDTFKEFMDAAYYLLYAKAKHDAVFAARVAALKYKFNTFQTPAAQDTLVAAAASGDVALAQQAIGAKINQTDFNGATPLMLAAQYGHKNMISWLLAVGADKDATDVFGESYRQYGVLEQHL